MIRLLLLQQLYSLSDEALEYQLLDRHSFVEFVGLEHSPRVSDAKTIWLWRERLKRAGLMEAIMDAVNAQLKQAGLVARGGQIVGASIVNAPVQRNTRKDNAQVKQDEVPKE